MYSKKLLAKMVADDPGHNSSIGVFEVFKKWAARVGIKVVAAEIRANDGTKLVDVEDAKAHIQPTKPLNIWVDIQHTDEAVGTDADGKPTTGEQQNVAKIVVGIMNRLAVGNADVFAVLDEDMITLGEYHLKMFANDMEYQDLIKKYTYKVTEPLILAASLVEHAELVEHQD